MADRYNSLPIWYNGLYEHMRTGATLIKSMKEVFGDKLPGLEAITNQFVVKDSIMLIVPNSYSEQDPSEITMEAYFPPGEWYGWWDYTYLSKNETVSDLQRVEIVTNPQGEFRTISAPLDRIPIYLRGDPDFRNPALIKQFFSAGHYGEIEKLNKNVREARENSLWMMFCAPLAKYGEVSATDNFYYDDGISQVELVEANTFLYQTFTGVSSFSWVVINRLL